jgi:hypothetical protein
MVVKMNDLTTSAMGIRSQRKRIIIVGMPRARSGRNDSSMLLYVINVSVKELVSIISVPALSQGSGSLPRFLIVLRRKRRKQYAACSPCIGTPRLAEHHNSNHGASESICSRERLLSKTI